MDPLTSLELVEIVGEQLGDEVPRIVCFDGFGILPFDELDDFGVLLGVALQLRPGIWIVEDHEA